jgi:tetratricopeptide (TPR) repeat protein
MNMESNAVPLDKHQYHEQVSRIWTPMMQRLGKLVTSYIFFHVIFLLIAGVELGFFLSYLSWLGQSTVLAFTLAIFFLTIFSYAVIRLYFQTKKPEELASICEDYFNKCKEIIGYQEGIPEHHMAIASALQKFASALHEKEYSFYAPPPFLKGLEATMEKFSAFCHWKDIHKLKELLLTRSIEEHIKVVKCEPTHLEVHARLANAYVMLSSLYADPRKYEGYDEERWIPPERVSEEMQKRFREIAERATEEFKILNHYAPDDPWVHIQLAYSYHDLQMPDAEIREYEIILSLRPDDVETLFKLGMLYFQQGKNAQGLNVYEKLKEMHYKKAMSLIKFYGAFDTISI